MATRRQYLKALGTGAVAGLAGCLTDDTCSDYRVLDDNQVRVAAGARDTDLKLLEYTVELDLIDQTSDEAGLFEFDYVFDDQPVEGSYRRTLQIDEEYDLSAALEEREDAEVDSDLVLTLDGFGEAINERPEAYLWVESDEKIQTRRCGVWL